MYVQGKLKYKDSSSWVTFRMSRQRFVEFIDEPRNLTNVEWLSVDVCLTRWVYDPVAGWFYSSKKKLNEPVEKWKLNMPNVDKIINSLTWSPKGFTQR